MDEQVNEDLLQENERHATLFSSRKKMQKNVFFSVDVSKRKHLVRLYGGRVVQNILHEKQAQVTCYEHKAASL